MHSQQPPGVVQNWSALQCSKQNTEQCGDDHAPVTRGRMRAQYPLPHGPRHPSSRCTLKIEESVCTTPTPLKGKDAETQESVQATPTLLKGKDASSEESVEGLEPRAHHGHSRYTGGHPSKGPHPWRVAQGAENQSWWAIEVELLKVTGTLHPIVQALQA